MKTPKLLILMLLALCIFACANDSEDDFVNVEDIDNPDDGEETPEESLVNYDDDIAPIMTAACIACHASPPTNGAPFSLVNFSQVNQRASGIFNRMNLSSGAPGAMPPSGRLPQSTIDLIQQWIDDGKPEN